jgi:hypothetical protein
MAFNPDEYLSSSAQAFNPDDYLGQTAQPQQEMTLDRGIKAIGGILPSAALGVAKPLLGVNQALWKMIGSNKGDWPVEKLNQYQQQLNQAAGPIASKFTTEPAALIGENLLPIGAANKITSVAGAIPSFGKMLAQNVGLGAATAYANPEKTGLTPEEFAKEKTKSMAIGASIPAGLSIGGTALTGAISPIMQKQAQNLINQGVELTPGQKMGGALKRLEDKLTSYPFVGGMIEKSRQGGIESFDKAAFKRVLEPIGGKVPDVAGREGMDIVESQVKHTYNELLPKLHFEATDKFNNQMSELRNLTQGLPNNLGETFTTNIDQIIAKRMSKTGTMDGINFKEAESDLSGLAKDYLSSSTASERNLGKAFKQALVNLRTGLAESNPEKAKELRKVNEAFANLSVVRKAASMANTQDMFTPSQLANAVKASDISAGKNKTATGKALMQDLTDAGVTVLPSKIPDSGTASRMNVGPLGLAIGAGSYIPYAALQTAMFQRPEFMNKMANALRGTSPFLTGPAVNKALGERNE